MRAWGHGLALGVVLCSSRVWAQAAESLPPAPPAPPGVEAPVAATPETVPPPLLPPASPPLAPPPPESSPPASPPPESSQRALAEPDRNWYGWQLLINDFVALGSVGGAAIAGVHEKAALAVFVPAVIVYDLGGPTIHWLHHRRKIAAASFGVRAGVPFVGVFVGMALASCGKADTASAQSCRSLGAGSGALVGFAVATALDASLLAWDAPKGENPRAGRAWTPTLTPRDGGATLGVAGIF